MSDAVNHFMYHGLWFIIKYIQWWRRHENVQFLEKLKQLVLFVERKLDRKVSHLLLKFHISNNDLATTNMSDADVMTLLQDFIPLSFYSEPDGPIIGSGTFKSTILVPGYFLLKCLLLSH
jgi:tripeptidyl-peptidase-2